MSDDNMKSKMCLCVLISVILFIVLAPGFIISIPYNPNDKDHLGEFASYSGPHFDSWRQTLTHAGLFGVIMLIVCCCLCGASKKKKK